MSQLVGGRYQIVEGQRVLVVDQFNRVTAEGKALADAAAAAAAAAPDPDPDPGPDPGGAGGDTTSTETDQPAAPAGNQED